ncbi:MAG TPA: ATPase, T2SS/T4P/T4SS family [Thermotogota bacterium]|nr:ATPase, T2SS/T4P/T4SS family [Thermotogota bacterium]HRW91395.1 ATPase, T2SS/T4P/T4SS family [Thermotogota bacterium]
MATLDSFQYKRLGEILLEKGLVSEKDIDLAVAIQRQEKKPLGEILVEKGFVTWDAIAKSISQQYNLPLVENISEMTITPDILFVLSKNNVENWRTIPFERGDDQSIHILTDQINNLPSIKRDIQFITGLTPHFFITSKPNLDYLLKEYFGSNIVTVEEFKTALTHEKDSKNTLDLGALEASEKEAQEDEETAPIIKFVNEILLGAIKQDASDIHIEPFEKLVRIRFRVDGLLRKITEYPRKLHNPVISRVKIISKLDIAERRLPQDGKFFIRHEREQYDFRVSTMPSVFGEKVVMRLLKVSNSAKRLEDLGFSDYNFQRFQHLLQFPFGIILITGPTGSGKSTTLVGVLNQIKSITSNIVTIEDPVEYSISGITQCQVHSEIQLTFARFLRAILRQDPDIIMVGEIRDKETAILATEASMTGHLVLSTLHTNSASAAVSRLLNLGVEPDLLGVSLLGVVGQRLVRTLCDHCKTSRPLTHPEYLETAKLLYPTRDEFNEFQSTGCQECRKSGYKGRTSIHEILIVDRKIRGLMAEGAPESMIEKAARKAGMRTMYEDGIQKALRGLTTIDEVRRVAINA